jgi:hypothetical protein
MKKFKKSRAVFASVFIYQGQVHPYYLVTPYDKRGREIPTSVNCAYNAEYYTERQAMRMAGAI